MTEKTSDESQIKQLKNREFAYSETARRKIQREEQRCHLVQLCGAEDAPEVIATVTEIVQHAMQLWHDSTVVKQQHARAEALSEVRLEQHYTADDRELVTAELEARIEA